MLESVSRGKSKTIHQHAIPLLDDNTYYAAAIHIGINNLPSNVKSTSDTCKDIIDTGLGCRNNNIGMISISSIVYSSKVNQALMQQVNGSA